MTAAFPDAELSTAPDPQAWFARFARSTRDRKVAGVAGGIGRALRIDPVIVRVAFVVLSIFGGSGVALYCLGWLVLPGERGEVSAIEAMLGRGRSSVSPKLTVVLLVVLLVSIGSTFTVGLPLLPVVGGAVAVALVTMHRRSSANPAKSESLAGQSHSRAHSRAHSGAYSGADDPAPTDPPASPFDEPAFWDNPAPTEAPRRFAWDPGETPAADSVDKPAAAPAKRASLVLTSLTFLVALLVGGGLAVAILGGWDLRWSVVSGSMLAVLAVGVLIAGVAGFRSRLVSTGMVLAVATLVLTILGFHGNQQRIGDLSVAPTSSTQVQSSYHLDVGNLTVDLSDLHIPPGQTVHTTITSGVGNVRVMLPPESTASVTCSITVGGVRCLDQTLDGFGEIATVQAAGSTQAGTLVIDVSAKIGDLEVTRG